MACCNVWGTARLNFETTFIQHFFSRFVSYTKEVQKLPCLYIVILHTLQMIIRHTFLLKMQKMLQSPQSELQCLCSVNNFLKGNANKCHFFVSTSQEVSLNVNNFKIKSSDCENHLGAKFDSKLRFDQYITYLCRTASKKIHALATMRLFMNLSKRRLLMTFLSINLDVSRS